jgi:uncharacterized protein YdhG (YjbR/CyaY superfamily)
MQSNAATVDSYLKEVPEDRLAVLTRLRALCLAALKGYDETMRYGMPCYEKNGIIEVSFASQKNTVNLYILKQDVMDRYKGELKGVSTGKGCIRFTKVEKIDFEVVKKILEGTYLSELTICG